MFTSPQFHVWDIVNDIRSVKAVGSGGARQNYYMPMKALVKRAHLIQDVENFDGNRIIDNSWDYSEMECKTVAELTQQQQFIRYTDPTTLFNTMTNLQKVQMQELFDRLMPVETLTMTDLTPTVFTDASVRLIMPVEEMYLIDTFTPQVVIN